MIKSSAQPKQMNWTIFFVAIISPLIVFTEIAFDVTHRYFLAFDPSILKFLHNHATTALDTIMVTITNVGSAEGLAMFVVLILIMLLVQKKSPDALFFALATGGAAFLNPLLKNFFHRTRPHLWTQIVQEHDFGFPSGHAMGSMAVMAALIVLAWNTRTRLATLIVGALFVVLVSFSRLYLGVHYPTDILAGWCMSLAWVMKISLLLGRFKNQNPHRN